MKAGKVLHIILIVLVALFLGGHILLNNKKIQQDAATHVVRIAQAALGTDVSAGRVQLVYPFGITIDDLTVYDLKHDTLAHAASVSLRLKPFQLLRNKVSITSVRVNSPAVTLSKDSIGAQPNYAFLVDLFGGSDNPMALRANSILIRNGSVRYDLKTAERTDSIFNPNHIAVTGLTANLSVKAFSTDSISVIMRKFAFSEHSGFRLTKAKGAVTIGQDQTILTGLTVSTPNSSFQALRFTAGIGMATPITGVPQADADVRSVFTGSDLKAFFPQLASMTDPIDITVKGKSGDGKVGIDAIYVHAPNNTVDLGMSGTLMMDSAFHITGCRFAELHGSFAAGLPVWLEEQFLGLGLTVPSQLKSLGDGTIRATADNYDGNLDSELEISAQAGTLSCGIEGQNNSYTASLNAQDIKLNSITGISDLGKGSLTAQANFNKRSDGYRGTFHANAGSLVYKKYRYRNIVVNGSFDPELVTTDLNFADRNGSLALNAKAGLGGEPFFNLLMQADSLNLAAYNLAGRDTMSLTTTLAANLSGKDVDNLNGKITVDSLVYVDREGDWYMDNFTVTIDESENLDKVISVYSDFMNMSIIGKYTLSSLPASFAKASSDVLPTIGKMLADNMGVKSYLNSRNVFNVNACLFNTDFMDAVFHYPVSISSPANLHMNFIDTDSTCVGHLIIPQITVGTQVIQEADLDINSTQGTCYITINGLYGEKESNPINIEASLMAFTDIVRGTYVFNNQTGDISGKAKTLSQFFRYDHRRGLKSLTFIDTTNVIINNTNWSVSIARISTDMHKVTVSDFRARNQSQHLDADGTISADSSDVFRVSMNNINLGHTLSAFGGNKAGIEGMASGEMFIAGLLGNPAFYGLFAINDFSFMDSYHGNLTADCRWNRDTRRVEMEANMVDKGVANTYIAGTYIPETHYMDVTIDAGHTDLHFLNTWTKSAFQDIGGRALGQLRLFGNLPDLDMEGQAILEDGYFVQDAVHTTFLVKRDTLWFEPGKMLFRDVEFYDEKGHDGLLTCILTHDKFSHWRVDMTADVADMLVYYQPRTEKSDIYASVYAEGSMALKYTPSNGLNISVNARTAPGTRIGYNPTSGSVADYNFLTIVDRNTVRLDEEAVKAIIPTKTKSGKHFSLDFNIECSEDALIEMSLASLNGFFRGNGDLSLKYDPKDGPIINGIYNLSYGQCSLSLEDLIRKNFTLMEGSYVRFNGAPLDTELSLQTYHNVNSVSIYDLDPSASSSNNVRVRCLMNINGNVTDPRITFDIDMPSGTSEEKDILASATSTEEQRNIQFMYLLAIGRFYTYDMGAMNEGLTPSTMESIVNSTVSGQINNLLSQVLDNEKVSISSNLSASSYLSNDATNLNNKELEGILEAHLLDNRLLVNGSFGYRENTINNTSNFIGDLEVKYKLFPRKGISIKGYNKANDKYFSKTTLTTQGVGLVFEKDF